MQAELGGALAEASHHPVAIALFSVLLALVDVFLALGEPQVNQACQAPEDH